MVEDGCVDDEELRFEGLAAGRAARGARLAARHRPGGSSPCAATSSSTGSPATPSVVYHGCVDDEDLRLEGWPRGVLPAARDWLTTPDGQAFTVRRDLELYGVTCHPEGFLQRRA